MSSITRLTTAAGALALCAVLASPASAQVSDNILVTATVTNGFAPLTISGDVNLQFGILDAQLCLAGSPCANAVDGQWNITGEPGEQVNLDFTTMPDYIPGIGGATGDSLKILWGTLDGHTLDQGTGGGVTADFDPNVTHSPFIETGGVLRVELSASAETRADQTNGDYQGTVVLQVAYF